MRFTANVTGNEIVANLHLRLHRGEVPGANAVVVCQLVEEAIEANAAVANAGAGADLRIERFGIAGVKHGNSALVVAASG